MFSEILKWLVNIHFSTNASGHESKYRQKDKSGPLTRCNVLVTGRAAPISLSWDWDGATPWWKPWKIIYRGFYLLNLFKLKTSIVYRIDGDLEELNSIILKPQSFLVLFSAFQRFIVESVPGLTNGLQYL